MLLKYGSWPYGEKCKPDTGRYNQSPSHVYSARQGTPHSTKVAGGDPQEPLDRKVSKQDIKEWPGIRTTGLVSGLAAAMTEHLPQA